MPLPAILPLSDVRARLNDIFPDSFPDRAILVGEMAARVIFVCLYGTFVTGNLRYFRPGTIIRFSLEQASCVDEEARKDWMSRCQAPGYRPKGQQWYADNTREPLRDDYIRNRAIPMGLINKRDGYATTSPVPIYSLAPSFAALFDPALNGPDFESAAKLWRESNLDPMVLKRMKLATSGLFHRDGDITVKLPYTEQVLRLSAGEAALITKDAIEKLAPSIMSRPIVVHLSMSDIKVRPELMRNAEAIELKIDQKAELPDIIIADVPLSGRLSLYFIEVVHSDGPITELRKTALLEISRNAGISDENVFMITAFNDRGAGIVKKRLSELALGSQVWFRTEPHLFMRIDSIALSDQRAA